MPQQHPANGAWSAPPAEVAHEYVRSPSGEVCGSGSSTCVVTLKVTDAAVQSDSDTLRMIFLDQSPG